MKNISDLYKKIGKKYNVSEEVVKMIERHNFSYIASHMRERKTDPILIHNFGTFSGSLSKTNNEIRKYIKYYKSGKVTREFVVEVITKLWALRNEIIKQKICTQMNTNL